MVSFTLSASASASAPRSPMLFPEKMPERGVGRGDTYDSAAPLCGASGKAPISIR